MTFDEELRHKVFQMRALGILELETSTGFARRVTLGPAPDGAGLPGPIPAPPADAAASEAKASADDAAKRAKSERLKFGAGR